MLTNREAPIQLIAHLVEVEIDKVPSLSSPYSVLMISRPLRKLIDICYEYRKVILTIHMKRKAAGSRICLSLNAFQSAFVWNKNLEDRRTGRTRFPPEKIVLVS